MQSEHGQENHDTELTHNVLHPRCGLSLVGRRNFGTYLADRMASGPWWLHETLRSDTLCVCVRQTTVWFQGQGVRGRRLSVMYGGYGKLYESRLWAVLMWLSFCFSRRRLPIRRSNPTPASSVCSGKARGLLSVLWILEVTALFLMCCTDASDFPAFYKM